MSTRTYPPKAAWVRHHPTARRIADRLLQHRDVLALSTGLLVSDIRTTFRCGRCTAMTAVGIARAAR